MFKAEIGEEVKKRARLENIELANECLSIEAIKAENKELKYLLEQYKFLLKQSMVTAKDVKVAVTEEEVEVEVEVEVEEVSDGSHTFSELYYHRMILFSVICNLYKSRAWKSKLHDDGTMYKDYFIVNIDTIEGQYSYHYHMDHWDTFKVKEFSKADAWDGHKPKDVTRLLTLID